MSDLSYWHERVYSLEFNDDGVVVVTMRDGKETFWDLYIERPVPFLGGPVFTLREKGTDEQG